MKWEKLITNAISAANGPVGEKVKSAIPSQEQLQKMIESGSGITQSILSQASELSNPHLVGMGLRLTESSNEKVSVIMPHRWRNRSDNGAIHIGAMTTLAEYTSNYFWKRQFQEFDVSMELAGLSSRLISKTYHSVTAEMEVPGEERERILMALKGFGQVTVESRISVMGRKGQKVAEFDLVWKVKKASHAPEVLEG